MAYDFSAFPEFLPSMPAVRNAAKRKYNNFFEGYLESYF